MKPWNIKHLQRGLEDDLKACNNNFEKSMVIAIGGRGIREFAEELSKTRKLTPAEIAIAAQYGYKS